MTPEPIWVDLGLPSGLVWRKMNIGAAKLSDPGLYFSWGNTEGHGADSGYDFSAASYARTDGSSLESDIPITNDAARVNIGSPWRMPTIDDFNELIANCDITELEIDGKIGSLFTSRINGKSIYIPPTGVGDGEDIINLTSGYYWSSSFDSETGARRMSVFRTDPNTQQVGLRRDGMPIRPVATLT